MVRNIFRNFSGIFLEFLRFFGNFWEFPGIFKEFSKKLGTNFEKYFRVWGEKWNFWNFKGPKWKLFWDWIWEKFENRGEKCQIWKSRGQKCKIWSLVASCSVPGSLLDPAMVATPLARWTRVGTWCTPGARRNAYKKNQRNQLNLQFTRSSEGPRQSLARSSSTNMNHPKTPKI